ncbi:hypothetical protein KCU90_g167, partial [Aureobasidium melanogenum]
LFISSTFPSSPWSSITTSWIPESTICLHVTSWSIRSRGLCVCGDGDAAATLLSTPPTPRQKLDTPTSVQKPVCEPSRRPVWKSGILGRLPKTRLPFREGVKSLISEFLCQHDDSRSKVAGSMVFVAGLEENESGEEGVVTFSHRCGVGVDMCPNVLPLCQISLPARWCRKDGVEWSASKRKQPRWPQYPLLLLKEYGWDGDVKRGDKSPFSTRQGPSPSSKTLTTEGNVGEPSATFLVCLDDRNEDITAATGAVVALRIDGVLNISLPIRGWGVGSTASCRDRLAISGFWGFTDRTIIDQGESEVRTLSSLPVPVPLRLHGWRVSANNTLKTTQNLRSNSRPHGEFDRIRVAGAHNAEIPTLQIAVAMEKKSGRLRYLYSDESSTLLVSDMRYEHNTYRKQRESLIMVWRLDGVVILVRGKA